MGGAGAVGRVVMDLLFPGRCLLCGEWLLTGLDAPCPVCPVCISVLPSLPENTCSRCGIGLVSEIGVCTRCRDAEFAFESNRALFAYAGEARRLLNAFKFGGRQRLADLFAERAAAALGTADTPIVPVPPRPGRRANNAVGLLARSLQRNHGRRIMPLLARTGKIQQKSLDLKERRENLLGRFRMAPGGSVGMVPAELIVIDDVFTTGATLDSCARVLKAAGCAKVRTLTLVIEE